jgi:hypothetical protein
MKRSTKAVAVITLAGAAVFTASAAYATSAYIAWNVNLPGAQQGILAGNQVKSSKTAAGDIHVTTVAAGYEVNAHQCKVLVADPLQLSCGTERFGLGSNTDATLPSGSLVAAGNSAFLELHNTTWTVVRVSSHGVWRAN